MEAGAGLALLGVPAAIVRLLVGVPLDTPAGLLAGRIAGAALFALGVACWRARGDQRGHAAIAVGSAMLFYNLAAVGILLYAELGLKLRGVALWPAIVGHQGLAVWCGVSLWIDRKFRTTS